MAAFAVVASAGTLILWHVNNLWGSRIIAKYRKQLNEYLIDWDSIRMTIGTNLDFERAEEAEYRVDLQLHQ